MLLVNKDLHNVHARSFNDEEPLLFLLFYFFCKAVSNVGPYGLFWQPALIRCSLMLYLCLLIGRIKMLAACLEEINHKKSKKSFLFWQK